MLDSFNERLQLLIDRKKISQADVAKGLGVSESMVTNWLNGKTKSARRTTLQKISIFFGCNIDWLATGEGEPFPDAEVEGNAVAAKEERLQIGSEDPSTRSIQKYEHLVWKFQHIFDFLLEAHEDDPISINDFMARLEDDFLMNDHAYRVWLYQKRELAAERQKKRAAENHPDATMEMKSAKKGNGL